MFLEGGEIMAKRKDIFKIHPNLRFLSIVFLSLAVIFGAVWYVNSYSERSSAAGQKPNAYCKPEYAGYKKCKGSQWCEVWVYKDKFTDGIRPRCNIEGEKFLENCKHSDRCDQGDNLPPPNDGEYIPPSNYEPVGRVDGTNNDSCSVWGWACDQDKWSKPLKVRITANGQQVGETTANIQADDVKGECGGYSNHRFNFSVPADSFVRGAPEKVVDVLAADVNSFGQQTGISRSI